MVALLNRFPHQPLDFFGALRASTYDEQIRQWIESDVLGECETVCVCGTCAQACTRAEARRRGTHTCSMNSPHKLLAISWHASLPGMSCVYVSVCVDVTLFRPQDHT